MSAETMFKELGFYKEQSEVINSRIWSLNEDCRIIFDAINEVIFFGERYLCAVTVVRRNK